MHLTSICALVLTMVGVVTSAWPRKQHHVAVTTHEVRASPTPPVCTDLDARWFGASHSGDREAAAVPPAPSPSPSRGFREAAKGLVDDFVKLTFFSGFVMYTDVMGAMGRRKQLLKRSLMTDTITSEGYWTSFRPP